MCFLDDDVNQNIGHNDPHILHMDEIPIVIEAENNIIPTKDGIISTCNHNKSYNIYYIYTLSNNSKLLLKILLLQLLKLSIPYYDVFLK